MKRTLLQESAGQRREQAKHEWFGPARATAILFLLLILGGTFLLMLPISAVGPQWTPFLSAFFTAVSAVSLTGLTVVDIGTYYTAFGQAIIVLLIQLGGLGIMSLAALSGLLITGRISLKTRHAVAAESRPVVEGGIGKTLRFTALFTLGCEALVAAIITARMMIAYGDSFPHALWTGIFHAVSAFNNAGFSFYSTNMIGFAADPWILLPLAGAIIGGGLGFPVMAELIKLRRPSMTAKVTLAFTAVLLVGGSVLLGAMEWRGVLAAMPVPEKLLNAFFLSVSPRTAGFNAIDYGEAHPITLMTTDALMFIGGGSAGTAGGIKVTTAMVLLAAMAAEFMGRSDTDIGMRRVPVGVVRQAMALTAAGVGVVTFGVAALRVLEPQFTGDQVAFEVFSAFATVGLTTGITPSLSAPSQVILCLIMYLGRVGPTTLVTALAARQVARRYRYVEERPFIG